MRLLFTIFLFCTLLWPEGSQVLPSSKIKGNIAECVYRGLYPTVGKIVGEYNFANGIDHIDVKRNSFGKITKCTITDSKFGNAKLGKVLNPKTGLKDIQQMSDEWILQNLQKLNTMDLVKSKLDQTTKNKIMKARNNGEYKQLQGLLKSGVCKKRVFNLKFHDDGLINTGYHDVKNDGKGVVKTRPIKKDKYANRLINPTKGKLDAGDIKLRELVYDCTATHICPKNSPSCVSKMKVKLYKSPKAVNSMILKASSDGLPKNNSIKSANSSRKVTKVLKAKTVRSLSASVAKKTALKGAAKGLAAGIASKLPFVGIAAQIAWDAYLGYKIEMHDAKIENNENNIQVNADSISRLEQESEVFGMKIDNNTYKISALMQELSMHTLQLEMLDEQISTLTFKMINMQTDVNQNTKKIEAINNGIFNTGIEQLNKYYETNSTRINYLYDAIRELDKSKKIEGDDVNVLVDYYLIIAGYELYINTQDIYDLESLERSYQSLSVSVQKNYEYLGLLNTVYLAISDLDKKQLKGYKNILFDTTSKVMTNKIKELYFDEALEISENYIRILNEDTSNKLYKKAHKAKMDNFEKNRHFTSVNNALSVIEKNQNSLLNEAVIKYLYSENDFENALKLLRTKRFDDNEFRVKMFAVIYSYLGNKEKLVAIKNMVLTSSTYTDELKKWIGELKI
ncbi:MAG: hypothetical protein KAI79_15250 [Bacteroidales bacterium]|nr:hypothetical protein [Bacteroidales bacterium]